MKYLGYSISDFLSLPSKEDKIQANKTIQDYSKSINDTVNAYISFNDKLDFTKGRLEGVPFALKDNFSSKGLLSTGGTKMLYNYVPIFNATVVEKLINQGAWIVGKTNLDELAMDGSGTTGYKGKSLNPYDLARFSGGSSGGSAVAVGNGSVPFSLGSDTGDSIRKPASYCGIVGFKPTWGRISRYGLFPFACSLDHVGFFTRNIPDMALLTYLTAGYDKNDFSSSNKPVPNYLEALNPDIKNKVGVVIKEVIDSITNKKVKDLFEESIAKLKDQGVTIVYESISAALLRTILPTYLVISCCEASSNNANLDGIKFGFHVDGKTPIDSIIKTRTKGFGLNVKKRFILGSYSLLKDNQSDMLLRAQKLRRLIVDAFTNALKKGDFIILPAAGSVAPLYSELSKSRLSDEYLIVDSYLAFANFSGQPSITAPMGYIDGLPLGVNITANLFDEQTCLDVAYCLEKTLNLANQYKPFSEAKNNGK
jgi:aspartyl-tRNA(Asn)/glutamyl-tRNA(Gln) amidotransferase subunit A